jgi:tetratricopeptide (TPR) repeat protein
MYSRLRVTALILFIILMLPGLALGARQGRILGKIVDSEGKPIKGVTVTVTSPDIPEFRETETTNKKGMFIVDFERIHVTYIYRFDKTGYQPVEVRDTWIQPGTKRSEWAMQQAEAQTAGGLIATTTSVPAVDAYNAGTTAFREKRYEDAKVKFLEATEHDPELHQAWAALSVVQLELGFSDDAAASAEKAIALGSTDEAALLTRWKAYSNLNDDAKAEAALKDLERVGDLHEEAKGLHNEAVALMKSGDDAAAFAKFQEALSLDPNLEVSLQGLAGTGVKIGKYEEAASAAETILKIDPGNENAVRHRYNACLGLGDKERLGEALVGLAAFEPQVARDGLLLLAFEAYDALDMALAKDRFQQVLAIDPNQPQAHYYLGVVHLNEGAKAEAKTYFERFLELAPDSHEANTARTMLKHIGTP